MKVVKLEGLPLGADDLRVLGRASSGVHGALYADAKAIVFGPACGFKSEADALRRWPNATLVWRRLRSSSRVIQALALVDDEGLTPHAAAKRIGVSSSAVYRGQTRRETRLTCPCCGHVT